MQGGQEGDPRSGVRTRLVESAHRQGVTLPEREKYVCEHLGSGHCLFRELVGDEVADQFESEFAYRWTHVPTGATGVRRIAVGGGAGGPARDLELLRKWNGLAPEVWLYT